MKQHDHDQPAIRGASIRRKVQPFWLLAGAFVAGCDGSQSALQPAGAEADRIAFLFWWMLGGGTVVWLVMIGLAVQSVRSFAEGPAIRRTRILIIGGGTVVPTIVLTVLLLYSLPMLPDLLARPPEGSLQIDVRGRMWWWRVTYLDGTEESHVELANEIRLPVGEPVEFILSSDDVIHAFWIPSLGGKMDMFPGRTTRLTLHPTKTGVFRGACAEYCGASHALMNFDVIVMEPNRFDEWLAAQRKPAALPESQEAVTGRRLFLRSGCHACHTVRGLAEHGSMAPDLTHVGSRHTIGAGILENDTARFAHWISHVDELKPKVRMPHFRMLPEHDIAAIAEFLEELQ